jgi:PAS domain S-box-containing protein
VDNWETTLKISTVTQKTADAHFFHEFEHRVWPEPDSSFVSPTGDIASLELVEIIGIKMIESLMQHFCELARIPMAILDLKGKVLVGVGWQDICTKFHRVHPHSCQNCLESDNQLASGIPEGKFRLYRCKNNMWEMATPIVVADKHVGNLFSGQFFFEGELLDRELFRVQASQHGFNEEAYLAALDAVPRLNRESLDKSMAFFMKLAQMISQMSYSNVQLARSLAEREREIAERVWTERALRQSEERFRTVANAIPNIVWSTDAFGRTDYINDWGYRYTGLTPVEALGKQGLLIAIHPEDVDSMLQVRQNAIQTGTIFEREYRIRRARDGNYRWRLGRCVPICDTEAKVVRWFGTCTDIEEMKQAQARAAERETEKKAAEAALIQSEKLASVGRMAATVAHEINNPLEAVTNCIYLAASNANLPPDAKEHLAIAERELHRVAHIAKRTLGFYRENAKPAVVDIRTLVDEVVELYDPKFTRQDIGLKIEHDGPCGGTVAIAGEIRQVVSNLLTNAIDASRAKGIIKVRTSRVTLNGCSYTRVTVADAGDGISRTDRRRIFEPFFTTKKAVGTGLGLWVSREIVQKHKGRIRLRSVEGKGTFFSVFLPA